MKKIKLSASLAIGELGPGQQEAGSTVELADAHAQSLIDRGLAVEVKARPAAPRNKDAGAAPANKGRGGSKR